MANPLALPRCNTALEIDGKCPILRLPQPLSNALEPDPLLPLVLTIAHCGYLGDLPQEALLGLIGVFEHPTRILLWEDGFREGVIVCLCLLLSPPLLLLPW